MGIKRLFREIPTCPVCDGPCRHELTRSEYRFPDRLPRSDLGNRSADPDPEKPVKPNRRGKRPEHHEPKGPKEDRMVRPSEDR